MKTIQTDLLEIAYEEGGPKDGPSVVVLHGWPDAPRGWRRVTEQLHTQGWHTFLPYLRGTGPTSFLRADTPRDGSGIALAQDVIDLADALDLDHFAVVGHDWGARVAYTLAALHPDRISSVSALALSFQPQGAFHIPSYEQSRRFWYQWFLCIDGGLEKVTADPVGFARIQWETWSPKEWFTEAEFEETAKSFSNPDWVAITANAYRSRWLKGEIQDARYDSLRRELQQIQTLSTPTLMIQGASDFCDVPEESEDLEAHFAGHYQRALLDGVGHFPHREAPDLVASHLLAHLRAFSTTTHNRLNI
jgi:pimeloyl-ACP methyl ester carboxylesterase